MEEWTWEVPDESRIPTVTKDAPCLVQPKEAVRAEYQVGSRDLRGRVVVGEVGVEDIGSFGVGWKRLAVLVAADNCPGTEEEEEEGFDTEDVLGEDHEELARVHASMAVVHTEEAVDHVHEEEEGGTDQLVCSVEEEGSRDDMPNVRGLVHAADNVDTDAHLEQDKDPFAWEDRFQR